MFNPARHYPLMQRDWDADVAQQTIEALWTAKRIAEETIDQLQRKTL